MGAVFFLMVIVGVIVIVIGTKKAREEFNSSWRTVAQRLGLRQIESNWNVLPRLEGSVSGHPVIIDIEQRGSGKSRVQMTRFSLGVPGLMRDLVVKEEGFLSSISKVFGSGDVKVGEPEFDRRYNIYGRSANGIRSFLNPRRRTVLDRFFTTHRGTVLKEGTLSWSTRGRIRNSSQMIATVEDMLTVALALATDEQVPAVAADASFDDVTPIDPAPIAAATVTEAEPAVVDEPEPEAARVNLDTFCASLFRPGMMSFEASKAFDTEFRGQPVAWSGVLQSIEPYSYDFVFGAGKGVKATLIIAEVEGGFVGKSEVKAILQLPAEAAALEQSIGERVEFSGTLTKVDGLLRKVFVADGHARR